MSSPEERPSFEEPSPPSGRVQSGFAASFLFESGNNEQANLPNNNINKGRWTEEEHKIFMQEYEKYGINCMQIAKVLSTRTPAQIKKHAECFFKQNLKTNSAANKRYRESLSTDRKAQVLVNDSAAHQKQRQSLSPENKTQMLCNNAAAQKKHRESLSPDDKVRILTNNAAAHKKQRESLSPEQKAQNLTNHAAEQKKYRESLSSEQKEQNLTNNAAEQKKH